MLREISSTQHVARTREMIEAMTEAKQAKRRSVGRPRSVESHQAILEATLELVAVEGIQGTSIEAIAARAGVGKSTIYRRWSTKDALIVDAINELHVRMQFIDTGHFRADLIASLKEFQHQLETQPLLRQLLLRVFGEAQTRPEFLKAFYERVFAMRVAHVTKFFAQAQARGELRADLDPFFTASLVLGPMIPNLVVGSFLHSHLTLNLPERIVDAVMQGIGVRANTGS